MSHTKAKNTRARTFNRLATQFIVLYMGKTTKKLKLRLDICRYIWQNESNTFTALFFERKQIYGLLRTRKKESYAGDFVLENQTTSENFRNVSKAWYDKCKTYDEVLDQIADDQNKIEDIRAPLSEFTPVVNDDGNAVLKYKDGREFEPTDHSLKNIAVAGKTSDWFLRDLRNDKLDTHGETVYKRNSGDAELLVHCLKQTLWHENRFDQDVERLWRTWDNGTLRAMLSNKYAIVNNQWMMEVVRETIPQGMVSHWRGNADNIFGNILIPDSIREEDDSDYGGMLSIGNSEIGMRRISSTLLCSEPFV